MSGGVRWTPGEDDALRAMWASGNLCDVPEALASRTWNAMKIRAHAIGVKLSRAHRSELSRKARAWRKQPPRPVTEPSYQAPPRKPDPLNVAMRDWR